MSDKVELPEKKTTVDQGKPESEGVPGPAARKRKTGRTVGRDQDQPAHGSARHAEPASRGPQGRRSDFGSIQSTAPERQRHPQALSVHRRMSMDTHRSRRSNVPNPASRPVRTRRTTSVPPGPPRSMLQHAWHTVLNSDPLVDSDEECPDEHLRLDYNRRMQVITRLRGRPPTPELECGQTIPI